MLRDMRAYSFVTTNSHKVAEARRITGVSIEHVELEMREPQERTCVGVALAKALEAYAKLGRPVIVEDSGLELSALGGFPGPFIKHWEQAGGTMSICTALNGFSDRSATAVCALVAIDGGEHIIAEGRVAGSIARYPRGGSGFGFDPIFIPASIIGMTFGELTGDGKDTCSHRAAAWRSMLARFEAGGSGQCA